MLPQLRSHFLACLVCSVTPVSAQAPVGLHAEIVGSGPLTVLVLHGGPGFRHNYLRPEWERLATVARVVFYDQRGCGRSDTRGPLGWEQQVQDLDALIAGVAPGQKVILAGSSWGAWLALLYAYRHPARLMRLILSGVGPWPTSMKVYGLSDSAQAVIDSIAFGTAPATAVEDSAAVADSTPPSVLPPALATRMGPFCRDAAYAIITSLRTVPPVDSLAVIQVPTLLIHGVGRSPQRDGTGQIAALLPHARVIDIAEGGHDAWYSAPDSVFPHILAFLAEPLPLQH